MSDSVLTSSCALPHLIPHKTYDVRVISTPILGMRRVSPSITQKVNSEAGIDPKSA